MEQVDLMLRGGVIARTIEGRRIEVNDHGVIVGGVEHLVLKNPRKGWRGCDLAGISIAPVPGGWAWATSYHFTSEGCSSPITLAEGPFHQHETTRALAISSAVQYLREQVVGSIRRNGKTEPAARATLAWLDQLAHGLVSP